MAERLEPSPLAGGGWRFSQVGSVCVERAGEYLPGRTAETDARDVIYHQVATIRDGWNDACDRARLTSRQRDEFWERQFLNPYIFYGY